MRPKALISGGLRGFRRRKAGFESIGTTGRYRTLCLVRRSLSSRKLRPSASGFVDGAGYVLLKAVGLAFPGCPARLERPARNDQRFSSALASRRSDRAHAYPPDAAPSGVRDHGHLRRNREALDEVLHLVPRLGRGFNRRFSSRLGPRPRAQGHQSKQSARSVVFLPEFSKRIIG